MSEFNNGGSIRVQQISKLLGDLDFDVKTVNRKQARRILNQDETWNLVVISSYSCASLGRLARLKTDFLWFDPYDSWTKSRISLFSSGSLMHLVLLLRDVFYTEIFPKTELVTFLTQAEATAQSRFCRKRLLKIMPLIPVAPLLKQDSTPRIVFVGDGSYKPNRQCLRFLDELGLALFEKISVIGKGYPHKKSFKNIEWLGYQSDSELYKEGDIHLAPISLGAGIKTKVVIPLMLGLPVVVFPELAQPFKNLPNLWTAKTPSEFATIIRSHKGYTATFEINLDIYVLNEVNEVSALLERI